MNVSPSGVEPSEAPYTSHGDSGDLVDRMRGNLPNVAPARDPGGSFADLKKAGAPDLKRGAKGSSDLEKATAEPTTEKASGETAQAQGLEGNKADSFGDKTGKKKRARKKWKKPKDKPNRPLSAYNLFFQAERAAMLGDDAVIHDQEKNKKRVHRKTHGKVGFAEMARVIGQKWKLLPEDDKKSFLEEAAKEKKRYATELKEWKELQKLKAKGGKNAASGLPENARGDHDGIPGETEASENLRRIMQDGVTRRNLSLLQAQRADSEYLRALQERQMAILTGRSNFDSGAYQYPSAAEASANAILQQFQNSMGGAGLHRAGLSGTGGMNPMGMNTSLPGMTSMGGNYMNAMGSMNPMGMNMMGDLQSMGAAQRQVGLPVGGSDRLQQLRGFTSMGEMGGMGGATVGMGNVSGMGNASSSQQGDLGRIQQQLASQYPGNDMAAVMARHLQNRYNM